MKFFPSNVKQYIRFFQKRIKIGYNYFKNPEKKKNSKPPKPQIAFEYLF